MERKFDLGEVTITACAASAVGTEYFSELINALYRRHACGDWGDCGEIGKVVNNAALRKGLRILSEYVIYGIRIWIITEADRSATTVLLPEEY